MPWQVERCQVKIQRCGNSGRLHKRTAGTVGGGRLSDARLFTARLAADIPCGCWEEFATEVLSG